MSYDPPYYKFEFDRRKEMWIETTETETETEECELGKHEFSGGQCVHCGEMDREGVYPDAKRTVEISSNFSSLEEVSSLEEACTELVREDNRLEIYRSLQNLSIIVNWNIAVYLWDKGRLFSEDSVMHSIPFREAQRKYAEICCEHLIPNGLCEPHVIAEGG